jgi:hypothetical protein
VSYSRDVPTRAETGQSPASAGVDRTGLCNNQSSAPEPRPEPHARPGLVEFMNPRRRCVHPFLVALGWSLLGAFYVFAGIVLGLAMAAL